MTYKLLLVDDEPINLRLLDRLFSKSFYCLTASSAAEAIDLLNQHDVAILITDQRMPGMTGIELLKQTAKLRPHMIRILLTGYTDADALVEAINCGLVHLYLTKPWNNADLLVKVERALEEYENNRKRYALQVANERLQAQLKEMKRGVAYSLTEVLRARNPNRADHAARVSEYAVAIAHRMSMSVEECEDIAIAASLHNLGHIGTPEFLLQSEPTSVDERLLFQAHSERGARILAAAPELRNAGDIVRFHHENFDGSGYPRGLRGEQIPLVCRIIRVAHEYDLLTRPKISGTALSHEQAIKLLGARAGKECDPLVIERLEELDLSGFDRAEEAKPAPRLAVSVSAAEPHLS